MGLHTPASVHFGTAIDIRAERAATLNAAYAANPDAVPASPTDAAEAAEAAPLSAMDLYKAGVVPLSVLVPILTGEGEEVRNGPGNNSEAVLGPPETKVRPARRRWHRHAGLRPPPAAPGAALRRLNGTIVSCAGGIFHHQFGNATPGSGMTCAITGPWHNGPLLLRLPSRSPSSGSDKRAPRSRRWVEPRAPGPPARVAGEAATAFGMYQDLD